jgi:branched-chain amino acid transport system ATP-binding protein
MLLDIKNIDVLYDDFQVIWDVSINVEKAEMVALLGPNGSGKSTILNTISNLVEHRNGTINFEDNLISNIPTYKRTELGISHVLERRRVFPHLETRSNQLAKTMSGGEQQMLAIARGMMGLPKLLMVDEPFLGLSPLVMKDLIKIFKNIVNEGISILFVEQNVRLALSMADRGYVLESGRLVIDGKSEDLIDNEKVTKVFLGN